MKHFLGIFLIIFWFGSSAYAGTVTAVSRSKGLVKVDEGTPSGLTKGAKVCVYGDNKKKVACGLVTKSTESYALVRIKSAKAIARVKKGQTANLEGGGGTSETGEITVASGAPNHRNNIKVGYITTVLTPSVYNRITYNPPAQGATGTQETLWKKQQVASSSLAGAYLEGEFAIGKTMALSLGLRYRMTSPFEAETDYSNTNLNQFVAITQSATGMGVYSDFTFLDVAFTKSLFYRMGSGLDIDMTTVTFTATQKDDTTAESNEIASFKSSLNVVSLRLTQSLSFMIGPLGMITPGVNVLIPVMAMGKPSATVNDPQAATILTGGEAAAVEDLEKAVDHKKASFAAEIFLAAFFAF